MATALIAWMSEILAGSVEQAAQAWGMSQVFVGVIVVAVIGNAARTLPSHCEGVEKSHGPRPLHCRRIEHLGGAVGRATIGVVEPRRRAGADGCGIHGRRSAGRGGHRGDCRADRPDGESNRLEGAMLPAVSAILAMAFYLLPDLGPRRPASGITP